MNVCLYVAFSSLLLLAGCSSNVSSEPFLIERDLESLPDEWRTGWCDGAVSNNRAILERALAVTNVRERIRLVRLVRDHFWHDARWYWGHVENEGSYDVRLGFIERCGNRLRSKAHATPETILESWRMRAEILDLIEEVLHMAQDIWNKVEDSSPRPKFLKRSARECMCAMFGDGIVEIIPFRLYDEVYCLTSEVWDGCRHPKCIPQLDVDKMEFNKMAELYSRMRYVYSLKRSMIRDWHLRYERYFKYYFSLAEDHRLLPPEYRPTFVKQIQRDFFQRPGMAYVDWDAIPEDFKKGIEVPSAVKAARPPSGASSRSTPPTMILDRL